MGFARNFENGKGDGIGNRLRRRIGFALQRPQRKEKRGVGEYQENCESESHKNNLCILSATRHKDGGAQE